mmetsp:Transcript_25667/g.51533  ORF Transcript_25667/g.51533 Transcript_25667/m.51533 type:complete len:138 (+) Transcript_25667:88-501(+)
MQVATDFPLPAPWRTTKPVQRTFLYTSHGCHSSRPACAAAAVRITAHPTSCAHPCLLAVADAVPKPLALHVAIALSPRAASPCHDLFGCRVQGAEGAWLQGAWCKVQPQQCFDARGGRLAIQSSSSESTSTRPRFLA